MKDRPLKGRKILVKRCITPGRLTLCLKASFRLSGSSTILCNHKEHLQRDLSLHSMKLHPAPYFPVCHRFSHLAHSFSFRFFGLFVK